MPRRHAASRTGLGSFAPNARSSKPNRFQPLTRRNWASIANEYLQSLIKRLAESRGFRVTVKKAVLDGHGHIDVAIEREGLTIACEICVTTRVQHELQNLAKCLAAGFHYAVLVASAERTLQTPVTHGETRTRSASGFSSPMVSSPF